MCEDGEAIVEVSIVAALCCRSALLPLRGHSKPKAPVLAAWHDDAKHRSSRKLMSKSKPRDGQVIRRAVAGAAVAAPARVQRISSVRSERKQSGREARRARREAHLIVTDARTPRRARLLIALFGSRLHQLSERASAAILARAARRARQSFSNRPSPAAAERLLELSC